MAVGGFVMAAAYPGAWLQRFGRRRGNRGFVLAGRALLPVAAAAWGVFFVLMEILPIYAPNVRDPKDIPASLVGVLCGLVIGKPFEAMLGDET